MKYALVGHGRMGRAIEVEASRRGHVLAASFGSAEARAKGVPSAADLGSAEVAFEFTNAAAAPRNVAALLDAGVAVVCGTTGWTADERLTERARVARSGVVLAANFSIGMALFYRVVAEAGRWYGAVGQHEPFLVEAHHRGKRDAPSGTARRLAAILLAADPRLRAVQEGPADGGIAPDVLPVCSIRAGSEPGTHVVGFDGPADRIVLEHRARGREGFALGAVLAAEWLAGKRGLRTFDELLDEFIAAREAQRRSAAAGEAGGGDR